MQNPVVIFGSLSDRQISALAYLENNETIDNRTYRALFNTSNKTAHQELRALLRMGVIRILGNGRKRAYRLNRDNKPIENTKIRPSSIGASLSAISNRVSIIKKQNFDAVMGDRHRLADLLAQARDELKKKTRLIEAQSAQIKTLKNEMKDLGPQQDKVLLQQIMKLKSIEGHELKEVLERIKELSRKYTNVFKLPSGFGSHSVKHDPYVLKDLHILEGIVQAKTDYVDGLLKQESNPIRIWSLIDQARELEVIVSFIRMIISRK